MMDRDGAPGDDGQVQPGGGDETHRSSTVATTCLQAQPGRALVGVQVQLHPGVQAQLGG